MSKSQYEVVLSVAEVRRAARALAGRNGGMDVIVRVRWDGIERVAEIELAALEETEVIG